MKSFLKNCAIILGIGFMGILILFACIILSDLGL